MIRLPMSRDHALLVTVRLAHTFVWAVFAGCVVAIAPLALAGELRAASACAALVAVEVAVLAANHWRCPLTGVAARYTRDRRDNFDIYLPLWLARHNKHVFGTLYVVALGCLAWAGLAPG
jgi:hypothetical protein